jgi:hypothetical protein
MSDQGPRHNIPRTYLLRSNSHHQRAFASEVKRTQVAMESTPDPKTSRRLNLHQFSHRLHQLKICDDDKLTPHYARSHARVSEALKVNI